MCFILSDMETWPVRLETELQGLVWPRLPPDPAPLSVQDPPTHTDTPALSLGLWSEPGPAGRAALGVPFGKWHL